MHGPERLVQFPHSETSGIFFVYLELLQGVFRKTTTYLHFQEFLCSSIFFITEKSTHKIYYMLEAQEY